jgi:putative FmdB family regulatory protein
MPIYEYACGGCESEFEVEQRITEDPVKACPRCRSRKVKRLISRTSFVLKGGGWYADLYAANGSRGKKDGAPAETSKSSPPESGSGSKSETKSETSSTTTPKKDKKGAKAAA